MTISGEIAVRAEEIPNRDAERVSEALLERRRRSPAALDPADVCLWNPGALGELLLRQLCSAPRDEEFEIAHGANLYVMSIALQA
jgi:hypothetical protein